MATEIEQETAQEMAAALKDMIQSRGWQLFEEQLDREWGPSGYGRRLSEAIASVEYGPGRESQLAASVQRIDATARAVEQLRAWPYASAKMTTPRPLRDRRSPPPNWRSLLPWKNRRPQR